MWATNEPGTGLKLYDVCRFLAKPRFLRRQAGELEIDGGHLNNPVDPMSRLWPGNTKVQEASPWS